MEPVFFDSAASFRDWLSQNHGRTAALQLGFNKVGSGRGGITYREALDQALCFGWIDGVRHARDDHSYTIRFSPRKPRSAWSEVNVARALELIEEGSMQPPGRAAFERRDIEKAKQYSYEERTRPLSEAYERQFRANEVAWAWFQKQPPSYQRVATWFVMSARREETRARRLALLIDDSAHARRLAAASATRQES